MSAEPIVLRETSAVRPPLVEMLHEWVTTVDHKRLGILYIIFALMFLILGGVEATIMRIQLIRPLNDFVSPQVFNRMFTMHGTTMIFFVAMPLVFGFGNYLVPLMIGARDMAFPRLNAFSFWMSAAMACMARGTPPTWVGSPMPRSRPKHFRRDTARTFGPLPC